MALLVDASLASRLNTVAISAVESRRLTEGASS
jgi:hypothetical protein